MDFRIPGLPHSVVKYAQSTSVRQLIQKIENHPARHALQKKYNRTNHLILSVQNQRQMIRDVGNIELCELLEDGTQDAVQSMFIILEHWYPLLHVWALLA